MPIEAVKIPQNVQIEDRIIGPITLRQIIITLLGSGLSYAIWSAMKAAGPVSPVGTFFAWIPAAIAAAFAFVKINDISLFRLMFLMIEKMEKPAVRTWAPRQGLTINIRTKPPKVDVSKVAKAEMTKKGISELSTILDTEPEDIPEQEVPVTPRHPVNPSRISVEPMKAAGLDGITTAKPPVDNILEDRIRDILPPKNNG